MTSAPRPAPMPTQMATPEPATSTAVSTATAPRRDGAAGGTAHTAAPIPSAALLRGQRVIEIDHEGQRYRLQATRQGKLILTK